MHTEALHVTATTVYLGFRVLGFRVFIQGLEPKTLNPKTLTLVTKHKLQQVGYLHQNQQQLMQIPGHVGEKIAAVTRLMARQDGTTQQNATVVGHVRVNSNRGLTKMCKHGLAE